MLKLWIVVLVCLFFLQPVISQEDHTVKIPVMNFATFEPYLHRSNDTLYLVNFWATWCVPCRMELPAIVSVSKKYADFRFKTIFVSLDFPGQLQNRVIPFVESHQITSSVILLDDPDQNSWISKVNPAWSGAIPFTVIYGNNFRETYAYSLTYSVLDSIINLKLNVK